MKKLLATLLAMVMALSLAAPAFADGPDGPAPDPSGVYTVDGEAAPVYKPGDAIPINAILPEATNDTALGIIGGADGPTAIFTSGFWGGASESYQLPDRDEYLAQHPGLEEELRAGAYDYFAQEYGTYWTAEEYMTAMELTEEEFLAEMAEAQLWDLMWAESRQRAIDRAKEALGGVPGQVGVMFNGQYIQFPDAAPELNRDGTMMAPVRTLVEALGGEVSYQDGEDKTGFLSMPQVVCTANGVTVTFEVNGPNVEVARQSSYDSGEVEADYVTMPVCTYQKNGRTYVPVRFLAGILGYEVGWDSTYETVILLDREALAAKIDEDFTILNKVQANRGPVLEEGKNYQADMKGNVTFTAFDTLNGNTTYQADLTAKQLFNTEAASGELSVKLSDNALDELMEQLTNPWASEEDIAEMREAAQTVLDILEDMEVILTKEGSAWFRAAALDQLADKENVWLAFDLGGELGELAFTQAGETTVGRALAQLMPCENVSEWSSAMHTVELLRSLYGDGRFTTTGTTSTLTIGLDTMMGLYADMGMSEYEIEEAKAALKEYEITLKVEQNGAADASIRMETKAQMGVPAMKITMDVRQSAGNAAITMNYHIANMGELEFTLSIGQKTTSDRPMTEPPEGAAIIDDGAMPLNL